MESHILIEGRFRMSKEQLSRGGFARVYDTLDLETQKKVVIKVNKKEKVHDKEL
jgi:serine/threonine protein kinase